MSAAVAKFVSQRILKESSKNNFGKQDPYFEEVPVKDRKGRPTGKTVKRRRAIPEGLSPQDAKVLAKVKRRAYILDNSINICGIRFGWSSLIGIFPFAGDAFDVFMALMVVNSCKKVEHGLDPSILSKMIMNVVIDFLIGLVPFIGDLADAFFRCNTKNAVLLEKYLDERAKKARNAARVENGRPMEFIGNHHEEYHEQPIQMQSPPRYENGSVGRDHVTGNEHPPPAPPKPTATRPDGRGGGGWFRNFSGQGNSDRDLEAGEGAPPPHPPRRNEL